MRFAAMTYHVRRAATVIVAAAVASAAVAGPAAAQDAARKKPPAPAPERPFDFPEHGTTVLDNGLTVFVVEDHRQPVVSARLMIAGAGSGSHTGEQAGLAAMTAALLRQGTATRSAQQIAESIDRVGGALGASAGSDSAEATVTVTTAALDTGFALLADIVQQPAFAADEIERWRRQTLSGLQVAYTDPEYLRDVVGQRVAYGDHPYGYPTDGFPDTVRALKREDAQAFHQARYVPGSAFLAVAGDITPAAALELARRHFGGWTGKPAEPPRADAPRQQRRVVVIDKPDAVQTQFGIVGAGVPRNHPDWLPLMVANQVLGGSFNSRLNLRLRAKEGLTYGARTGLNSERFAGLLSASSFTRTEETAKAIKLTLDVVTEFRDGSPTAAELAEATSYLSGVFAIQTETAGSVASRVLTSALHGLPPDYWQTYRQRVKQVTAADVAAAVERHLVPDQMSIVAVGNAGAFAKTLEPFGSVTVVPLARLDLTQPGLMAKSEAAAGPDAGARGLLLIEQAAEAVGGAAALAAVKDVTAVGAVTLTTPGGEMKGQTRSVVQHPDKVRVVITLPVGELVQVYDGARGWMRIGPQPAMELPPPMQAEMQRSIVMNGGIGILREALEGRAQVGALEAKEVDGTRVDRVSWKQGELEMILGLDPATHRIVAVSYRGMTPQGPADTDLRVGEYTKAANGPMVPTRATTYQNGQKVVELTISEWQFNTGVAADMFVKPE